MGVDYYAYAVFGARIDVSVFTRKTRAFKHEYPEDWAVDPKTGRKLWHEESGADVMEEQINFGPGPKIDVCEIGYESGRAVVGIKLCKCQGEEGPQSGLSSLSSEQLSAMSLPLINRLREAGLKFNDQDFGIHVVMRVSV